MKRCVAIWGFTSRGKVRGISCGLWTCPYCAKVNARLWAWRAKIHINRSKEQYYFTTLTLPSKYKTAAQGFAALPKLWDGFRKDMQRYYAKKHKPSKFKLSYLAFVEGQEKRGGMPHFHILLNVKTPYRVKDYAVHHGFGHQAVQKPIDGGHAASYVAKYASKGGKEIPKGFRRVRASQDWAKLPEKDKEQLFVQAKNETLTQFIMRVANETDCEPDDLLEDWFAAKARYSDESQPD